MSELDKLVEEGIVDQDVLDEVNAMTPEEKADEVARIDAEGREQRARSISEKETTEITKQATEMTKEKGEVVTLSERKAVQDLVMSGATPDKAMVWVVAQRTTGLDITDVDAKEVTASQFLQPDKIYQQEAEKRLINEVAMDFLESDKILPQSLRDQAFRDVSMARSLGEGKQIIKTALGDYLEKQEAVAAEYIYQEATATGTPLKLKNKILALSAKNKSEAIEKVERAIRNYRG